VTSLHVYITPGAASQDIRYRVDGFSKHEFFGCEAATVSAIVAHDEVYKIERLVNVLGNDILITDETGEPRWWGYIAEVILQRGSLSYGVSMDNLYNSISVAYSDDIGARGTTAWSKSDASVGRFGEKQLRISATGIDALTAAARQGLALQDMAYPNGSLSFQRSQDSAPRATLRCEGYGAKLNWRYYSAVDGVHESTISSGGGQAFGEGTDINRVAMKIDPNSSLSYNFLDLPLQKINTPSEDVIAEIREVSETGTIISTATFTAASIPTEGFKYVRSSLTVPVGSSVVDRWLVIYKNGASNPGNYYKVALDTTKSFSPDPLKLRVGVTWQNGGIPVDGNMNFRLVSTQPTTTVMQMAITSLAPDLFAGIDILTPSDTTAVPYANGDQRLGQEMEELLQLSRYAGQPVFARVTPQKRITIYSASPGFAYGVDGDGNIYSPDGALVPTSSCPVGVYMRTLNVFPTLEQTGVLAAAGSVIVSRAEYQASYDDGGNIVDESYSFVPRGADDPFDENLRMG
jgi:hypothetical protein